MSYEFGLNHIKEKFKRLEGKVGDLKGYRELIEKAKKEAEIDIEKIKEQLGFAELEKQIAELRGLETDIGQIKQKVIDFENKLKEVGKFIKLT